MVFKHNNLIKAVLIIGSIWIGVALGWNPPSHAQDDYAASLTITQPGVEIRRGGTEQWIALPLDAVTPFGVGDRVRTDRTGRAYLQFLDTEMLVLPESVFELVTLRPTEEDTAAFAGYMEGRSVYFVPSTMAFSNYQLQTPSLTVLQPAQRFGIDSPLDRPGYVVSAEGELVIEANGQSISIPPENGIRVAETISPLVEISQVPINFARVEGRLDGCPGVIQTAGDQMLRVRAGPNDEFYYMGSIADATPVDIIGVAAGGGGDWYRIQFLSDFGWVLAAAVETNCTELTRYSPRGVENAPGIILVKDFEIPMLEPFFGQPEDDVWFYRRVNFEETPSSP